VTYSDEIWYDRAPPFQGVGPSVPQIFGTYMRAHSVRNNNQILHGDQIRCEEYFYTVDHEY